MSGFRHPDTADRSNPGPNHALTVALTSAQPKLELQAPPTTWLPPSLASDQHLAGCSQLIYTGSTERHRGPEGTTFNWGVIQ